MSLKSKLKGVKPSQDRRGTIWTSFLKEQLDKLLPEGLNMISFQSQGVMY